MHLTLLKKSLLVFVLLFILVGCYATVPKESVELSYAVGEDIDAVHQSYKVLIHQYFDNLRGQTINFIDTYWTPIYLKKFIEDGDLVKLAQDSDPTDAFEGVQDWVDVAISKIENKRTELLKPINQDEISVLQSVDDAFSRLVRANAAITAQLNSIRQVQQVQDDALKALKLEDLRNKINEQLSVASIRAEKAIDTLKKADETLNQIEKKKT